MSDEHVVVRRVRADDPAVAAVVAVHVAAMDDGGTPAEARHRLDLEGLLDPSIIFFAAYDVIDDQSLPAATDGVRPPEVPIGIGAFAHRGADWGEVKSMHVLEAHRGRGISRALLEAIEGAARAASVGTLRLETGRSFAAAITLYERSGFVDCGAFGDYTDHPASLFMEKRLS